jgi:hypothetical protein
MPAGSTRCPERRAIVAWLQDNQASFAPVVDAALLGGNPPVIDLSVSTPLLGAGPEKDDADAMTRIIFREMEDAGSALGIGRYNEARLIYTAEAFKVETDTAPEYRTVHLGLDLFARPGDAGICLHGRPVHSFRNNDAHQDYGPTIILSHRTDSGIPFYSLYGHLAARSLDGLEPGMPISAGQRIGTIGTANGKRRLGTPPALSTDGRSSGTGRQFSRGGPTQPAAGVDRPVPGSGRGPGAGRAAGNGSPPCG